MAGSYFVKLNWLLFCSRFLEIRLIGWSLDHHHLVGFLPNLKVIRPNLWLHSFRFACQSRGHEHIEPGRNNSCSPDELFYCLPHSIETCFTIVVWLANDANGRVKEQACHSWNHLKITYVHHQWYSCSITTSKPPRQLSEMAWLN